MTGILAYGVKGSIRFNNILNVVNFLVWVFIMIAGLFYASGDNWAGEHGGFAPYGMSGVSGHHLGKGRFQGASFVGVGQDGITC